MSSLADYAVVMMSACARHCGCSRLNAGQLSGETGLPLPTVQKLVSRLSTAGLLRSSRGMGGGFTLARPPASISLAEIIEAVEGPIAMTTCVDHSRDECALDHHCAVKPHWPVVNEAVRGALAAVSLSALVIPAKTGADEHRASRAGGDLATTALMGSRLRRNDEAAVAA